MKLTITITILLAILFMYGCKHEAHLQPTTDPIPVVPVTGSNDICFKADILPIIQTNCAKPGCHDDITQAKDFILNTYDNICSYTNNYKELVVPGNSDESKLYKIIVTTDVSKIMPPMGHIALTQAQKDIIKKWIDQGAKKTICSVACDDNTFTFKGAVEPIIQNRCAGCHSSPTMAGGFILTSYTAIKNIALGGQLYPAITHSPNYIAMPFNGDKLSDCQINQIKKWIDAGCPYN